VGVISNEFGELGIDAALLGSGEQRFVELAGGCICCELSDELVETLTLIRERVDPAWIVIETSGVALPFETQLNLYRPPVNSWVGDEAVVVVVDACQLQDGPDESGVFDTQVSGADLLLLHKIDAVSAELLPALQENLQARAPDVPILQASFGNVSIDLLFPEGPRVQKIEHTEHDHDHAHTHLHTAFDAKEIFMESGLSPDIILEKLGELKCLRIKGFVLTSEGPRIVQGVGRRIELQELGDLVVAPELWGRVVTISKTHRAAQHAPTHH
jgi:G3E family GTPase